MSTNDLVTLLCGIAIGVGVLGTIVPVLPGSLLVGFAVLVWAIVVHSPGAWLVLAIVLVLLGGGEVFKYLTAGKKMVSSGVPKSSLLLAGLVGIAGFFVIPVLGLLIGFVAGLALAEYARHRQWPATWAATRTALAAVGIIVLVELATTLLSAAVWGIGVWRGAAS